jgi:hypothetical protein
LISSQGWNRCAPCAQQEIQESETADFRCPVGLEVSGLDSDLDPTRKSRAHDTLSAHWAHGPLGTMGPMGPTGLIGSLRSSEPVSAETIRNAAKAGNKRWARAPNDSYCDHDRSQTHTNMCTCMLVQRTVKNKPLRASIPILKHDFCCSYVTLGTAPVPETRNKSFLTSETRSCVQPPRL